MMTFKEYLIESTIMSRDALKQAMSDYEQRGIGKPAVTKPKSKRLKQMDKRRARKYGSEEEEVKQKKRGRPKTPWMLKPQSGDGQPEEKAKRGRPRTPEMLKPQAW